MRLVAVAAVIGAVLLLSSCGFARTTPADSITDHSARLTGKVASTDVGDTRYHFEYGTSDAYGTSSPEGTVPITDVHVPVVVSTNLEGLAEGTTYHHRLCAFDADGDGGCSPDATFVTTSGHDYVLGVGYAHVLESFNGAQVDVHSASDGSDPAGTVFGYRANNSPARWQFPFHGDATCLRVEGNQAVIGAMVGVDGISTELSPVLILIHDGATTGTTDRVSLKELPANSGRPTTCPVPNEADFPQTVIFVPSPPYPVPSITVPREVAPGYSYDFVVHDHP
jgi:hypothetical protein